MKHPIPVCGTRASKPYEAMPISLFWRHDLGLNWRRGEVATVAQLSRAIAASIGHHLPNDLLPSLSPGDVVKLKEGVFWIDPEWKLIPIDYQTFEK